MKHRKISIIFCAIVLLALLVESTSDWATTEKGHKYLIESRNQYSWFDALTECSKRNLSLVAIDSPEKNDDLVKLLKNRFGTGADLWIGGVASTAEYSNRKFLWSSNGKSFDFANWELGEPNNLGGEQPCVHIWSKTNDFTWADGQWYLKYGYICEEAQRPQLHQNLDKKYQDLKKLTKQLISFVKAKQKHIEEINQVEDIETDEINIELDNKMEQTQLLIDKILEES